MTEDDFNFLNIEFATKTAEEQERYHDIVESLMFSVSIRSMSKIDFEFNNLLDLLDDIGSSELDKTFDLWKYVIDEYCVK